MILGILVAHMSLAYPHVNRENYSLKSKPSWILWSVFSDKRPKTSKVPTKKRELTKKRHGKILMKRIFSWPAKNGDLKNKNGDLRILYGHLPNNPTNSETQREKRGRSRLLSSWKCGSAVPGVPKLSPQLLSFHPTCNCALPA